MDIINPILIINFFLAVLVIHLANNKNRNVFGWGMLGFVIPIIALPLILIKPMLCPACKKQVEHNKHGCEAGTHLRDVPKMNVVQQFRNLPFGLKLVIVWFLTNPALLLIFTILEESWILIIYVAVFISWLLVFYLIKLKEWARKTVVVFLGITVFLLLSVFIMELLSSGLGNLLTDTAFVFFLLPFFVALVVILWYVSTKKTKSIFALSVKPGMDKDSLEMLLELRRWNWGAFFLNWIWGLGNRVYAALWLFFPGMPIVMPFILGVKGSEWAWEKKKQKDIKKFKCAQKYWTIAGVAIFTINFLLFMVLITRGFSRFTENDYVEDSLNQAIYNKPRNQNTDTSASASIINNFPEDIIHSIEEESGLVAEPLYVTRWFLDDQIGIPGAKSSKKVPENGISVRSVSKSKAESIHDNLYSKFKQKGYLIFLTNLNFDYSNSPINSSRAVYDVGVIKADDQYEIIKRINTQGPNYNISNKEVIDTLKDWENAVQFKIVVVDEDRVEAKILKMPESVEKFAKQIFDFSPDTVYQGTGTLKQLVEEIGRDKYFWLWWD